MKNDKEVTVWKLSIKPGAEKDREKVGKKAFDFCKKNGLVGVGWSKALRDKQSADTNEAFDMVEKHWKLDKLPYGIRVLFKEVTEGDHIWIHQGGSYYVCIVKRGKRVGRDICSNFLELDLGFAIEVKWHMIPESLVIGTVQRGVIAQRMIQRIHMDEHETAMYEYLVTKLGENENWEHKLNESRLSKDIETCPGSVLFRILSPDDVEDIVAARFQCEGWILIKSTCFRSKPRFEFSMICEKSGVTGAVQVKSGKKPPTLVVKEYLRDHFNKVFLFSTHTTEPYDGESGEKVKCLDQKQMINWLKGNLGKLPVHLLTKLQLGINAYNRVSNTSGGLSV